MKKYYKKMQKLIVFVFPNIIYLQYKRNLYI